MRTKTLLSIALAIFILMSALCLARPEGKNHDKGFTAAELTLETTQSGNQERQTYVNSDGTPVMPLDRDYATLLRTKDDDGNVILEQYLDARGEPVLRSGNYAAIAYHRETDEIRITYLDAQLKPTTITSGYSDIHRTLTQDGKALRDTYYDLQGKPVKCSGGYFGLMRSYDDRGRVREIVYLDTNGKPTQLEAGYSREVRVLEDAGRVAAVYYRDAENNPVPASQGQYGEGYETLMFRETGEPRTALIPFSYLGQFRQEYGVRLEVINNIWLFVPLGAGLYRLSPRRRVLWIPVALTVGIELTQYLTGLGLAQADDILGNTFGAVVGFLLADRLCSFGIWPKNWAANGETG